MLCAFVTATHINEIMYNPAGNDNNHEFVEVFTDQDLTGWMVGDLASNDTLNLIFSYDSNYSLIVEEGFNYSDINATIYSVGTTIGDNLNNGGDTLYLYDANKILFDYVDYNDTYANNNGYSIELIDDDWYESCRIGGSPGLENNISCEQPVFGQDVELEVYLDEVLYLGQDYTKLFKITNVNYEFGLIYNVSVNYNITKGNEVIKQDGFIVDEINRYTSANTGEFKSMEEGNFTFCGRIVSSSANDVNLVNNVDCGDIEVIDTSSVPCNITINITSDKTVYEVGETLKFHINLNNESFPYEIEYWVEDLFGDVKKNKYTTTNTNQKSWTPSIDERDKAFLINAYLKSVLCDDSLEDNHYERLVVFKDEYFQSLTSDDATGTGTDSFNSSIIIEDISLGSDNKTEFGKTVMAKVRIYKGDTGKYSVQFYCQDTAGNKISSQTSKASLYTKFTEYVINVPVQLKTNCDSKYDDGVYEFIVSGLDNVAKKSFRVEGITSSLCDGSCSSSSSSTTSSKKVEYSIDSMPEEVKSGNGFSVAVRINNNYDEQQDFEIIGYLYRGSKHYSEEVQKSVSVPKHSSTVVALRNVLGELEPGDYKYKVKIKREGLKPYRHLNSDIFVEQGQRDAKIERFYIEADDPGSEIKLYADVVGDNVLTVLETFYTTIETNLTGSLIFPVKLYNGKNLFFLKLVDDDETILDVKQLVVELEEDSIESMEEKIDLYSEEFLLNDFDMEPEREVIYLSSSERAKNLVPYFIIGMCALLAVVIMFKKNL
ncbi:lamin tail domain-containing protein [Candidatus Woesearchaeota archaeon]|nr:lamin tail domain-containing protein [Candidatus Woesearchaeota archaeon]